jgi:hypothetical protein
MSARLWGMLAALALATGCGAVVRASPLSGRPDPERGIYLSTGGAPSAYRTVGFAQVRGYGVSIAGLTEVGDAALDGTIKGALADACRQLGGDGVINIEFLDENPQTTAEKISAAANTASSFQTGQPQVQTRDRFVTVTGEIIQFVRK